MCPECKVSHLYERKSHGDAVQYHHWLKCPTCGYCEHVGKYKETWGPGYRFFKCFQCGEEWKEKCRDWTTHSSSSCPKMHTVFHQYVPAMGEYMGGEPHYEWATDASGNLLEEIDHETDTESAPIRSEG